MSLNLNEFVQSRIRASGKNIKYTVIYYLQQIFNAGVQRGSLQISPLLFCKYIFIFPIGRPPCQLGGFF
jgi:hypothetical protein